MVALHRLHRDVEGCVEQSHVYSSFARSQASGAIMDNQMGKTMEHEMDIVIENIAVSRAQGYFEVHGYFQDLGIW